MKSAVEQLSTYKSVHLNPSNITTHFFGVPLIVWSAFLALNLIPVNFIVLDSPYLNINIATIIAVLSLVYYFVLHAKLAVGLALFMVPVLLSSAWIAQYDGAGYIAIVTFVVGWIIQFVGHKYEKAKPAFIDDLNQLLIGPFFLMAEVYFKMGLEQALLAEITPLARDKRRAIEAAKK
ncbi:Mpo1 family 2-hydroxy fatty acid dioxygenase [Shewanella youngdeokensis]|uniref:Mpo1-like protein n=1 Tax=Shewanella youngdeokensis TaxID=2999068 RepID=A0ABZ0JXP9_9GAMM|nr:Mpo1-like protein [Shewanella sp. DAU334]